MPSVSFFLGFARDVCARNLFYEKNQSFQGKTSSNLGDKNIAKKIPAKENDRAYIWLLHNFPGAIKYNHVKTLNYVGLPTSF